MKNVLEYLERSAGLYPDKVAIADAENRLTYKELKEQAQCIGSLLIEKLGVTSKMANPVAVLMDKCAFSLAAFMGVVYSGNFYVVIDAEMPAERINTIFEALLPVAVLTDTAHMDKAKELKLSEGGIIVGIEDAPRASDIQSDKLNQVRCNMIDTDPVYALFTSGSTGVPKGAVVSHRNVISYTTWYTNTFGIDSDTVFGNQTPFYFSMSVSDVYSSLSSGATLQIIPKSLFSFPIKLMEFMNERKINTIYWVPSALCIIANWKMFQYASLPLLKKVLFAGEVMPTRQLNYWIENLPDATFANLFGPTETTDICTYYVVNRSFADDEPLPMGNACNNCSVFVLDEAGQLVTPEIDTETGYSREGELYARGSFVAMGYYGNREKTETAFIQNPLNDKYPELVYKTGDLVKYNQYGELVYVTRKDFQIKHMGYRIELGEVEAAAGALSGIKACAAVFDAEKDKIVFVYEGRKYDDKEIIDGIGKRVPHYMLPNVIVRIKSMPHNQNGKIDRKWLTANYETV